LWKWGGPISFALSASYLQTAPHTRENVNRYGNNKLYLAAYINSLKENS
jgi:hypothetical protein